MKILILDPLKLSYKDGCDIHRIELIKNFCELQNDVYILVKDNSENNDGSLLNLPSINIIRINPNKILKLFLYINTISRLAIKEKLDVFYTRNTIYCALGLIFKKINKSSLVFEKNGIMGDELKLCKGNESKTSETHCLNLNIFGKVINKIHSYSFLESIELFLLQYSDIVIAVTPLLKEYLVENGIDENKIHVIENGANTDLFRPVEKKIAREQIGFDKESNYVCFVGNLAPWQGLEYLINAAPNVLSKVQVNFLIVGDGILREKLEKMVNELGIKDNFIFTGLVPYDSVPLYINASDVCVAPFIKERNEKIGLSPLKIYEYMACGKPVISSRIPNLEFIEEQNAGLLVEPENTLELASALVSLLSDDEFEDIGANSSRYINLYHSWKHVSMKILEISQDNMRRNQESS